MANKNLKENKFKRALAVPFRSLVRAVSKKWYIELQYRYITHQRLDLKNPLRYTEKLQYLRLYTFPKNELVSKCAGRASVRDYIKENGFEDTLIPIFGVFEKFDDIDFSKLPNQFVMKATHACAFNYICLDKSKIDMPALRKQFNKWLKTDYGKKTVEPHYSSIKKEIIIEHYLGNAPTEYKIHVFNGVARYMYVVTGRGTDIRYNNYYIDWTPFDGAQFNGWKKRDEEIPIPENWDEMVKMSEKLGKPFPFVRVDLYNINGKIYFSEMTFTPAKGTLILDVPETDYEIGKWLNIETK